MISAVDTNILNDVVQQSVEFAQGSIAALRHARASGIIVICDVVYAELCVAFDRREQCDKFLAHFQIKIESLDPASSFIASRSWLSYLKAGGKRHRVLPDFLIAAHAANQADVLITRDHGFYRSHFPHLKIVDPTRP